MTRVAVTAGTINSSPTSRIDWPRRSQRVRVFGSQLRPGGVELGRRRVGLAVQVIREDVLGAELAEQDRDAVAQADQGRRDHDHGDDANDDAQDRQRGARGLRANGSTAPDGRPPALRSMTPVCSWLFGANGVDDIEPRGAPRRIPSRRCAAAGRREQAQAAAPAARRRAAPVKRPMPPLLPPRRSRRRPVRRAARASPIPLTPLQHCESWRAQRAAQRRSRAYAASPTRARCW